MTNRQAKVDRQEAKRTPENVVFARRTFRLRFRELRTSQTRCGLLSGRVIFAYHLHASALAVGMHQNWPVAVQRGSINCFHGAHGRGKCGKKLV
jgi:hypothetical protein